MPTHALPRLEQNAAAQVKSLARAMSSGVSGRLPVDADDGDGKDATMPELRHKIVPCLWFDNQAQEAAEFYTSVFADSRIIDTTYYGKAGPGPEGAVLTVTFELDGQEFVALNGGPQFTFSEAVSFQVLCENQDEIDEFWAKLSEGGEEGPCGWLRDRFGLSWQIVPTRLTELLSDPDPGRSERAMRAMLEMGKIDIAAAEAAADAEPVS